MGCRFTLDLNSKKQSQELFSIANTIAVTTYHNLLAINKLLAACFGLSRRRKQKKRRNHGYCKKFYGTRATMGPLEKAESINILSSHGDSQLVVVIVNTYSSEGCSRGPAWWQL